VHKTLTLTSADQP